MSSLRERADAGPRFHAIIGWHTIWPLWDLQKWRFGQEVWVEIDYVPPFWDTLSHFRRGLEELHRLQKTCQEEGLKGWLVMVPHQNRSLIRALDALGVDWYEGNDARYRYGCQRAYASLPQTLEEGIANLHEMESHATH